MKQRNIDRGVFWPSIIVTVFLTLFLALNRDTIGPKMDDILNMITHKLDWAFEFLTFGVFVLLIYLIFSRYGKIKLGQPGEKPEFSRFSWATMLFAAGMGTSIMLWSIVEPLSYMNGPPFGIEANTMEAAKWSVTYALFHWGVSAWALYALPAVAIAYSFHVRRRPSLKISTASEGILGKYSGGWIGKAFDVMVIWSIVGGFGTTLGLGVPMISGVIGEIFGIDSSLWLDIVIVLIWTVIYSSSAYLGLYKGIQKLSNFNVYIAFALAVFVFIVGPTFFILTFFTDSFGMMLQNFVSMSFSTDSIAGGGFPQTWTVFYWAWFASMAPFMGLFIARISKGRTIRDLILNTIIWGSVGGWVYFGVFGGYSVDLELRDVVPLTDILANEGQPATVVAVLKSLPLSELVLPFFAILGFVFLATSMDSATYIIAASATKKLKDKEEPQRWHRMLWGIILAVLAISLLAIGGLSVVQTSAVFVSVPVIIIYVLLTVSLLRWLKADFNNTFSSQEEVHVRPVKDSYSEDEQE